MNVGGDVNLPTLWDGFMFANGERPDRHPVELFGEDVVNRIYAGAEDWHWRRIVWPGLIGLACSTAGLAWNLYQMPGSILWAWFAGAVSLLASVGAFHVWRDHRILPSSKLHFRAKTEEQHRWLDRLEIYLGCLRDGTIRAIACNANAAPTQEIRASVFADNNGRILVLDSRYGRTDRAYRAVPKGRILARVSNHPAAQVPTPTGEANALPVETATARTDPVAQSRARDLSGTSVGTPSASSETSGPLRHAHHLHELGDDEFEQLLAAFLAIKDWDKPYKEEFAAIQRVTHQLVQGDPHMKNGTILKALPALMLDQYGLKLTLKDDSVSKMIGNSSTHRYGEFRNFVLAQTKRAHPNDPADTIPPGE